MGADRAIIIISAHHRSKQYMDKFILLNRMNSLKTRPHGSSFWLSHHVARMLESCISLQSYSRMASSENL